MQLRRLTTREIATAIADRLFTDGTGRKAQRLVFEDATGKLRGGWAFEPAVVYIENVLSEMLEQELPAPPS